MKPEPQILQGIRVLELGQLIAGPFAAKTLADFGARVIKVESPSDGDPLRKWRMLHAGTSVWWEAQSRNKESICIDLRQSEGQNIVTELIKTADVLIENFKPGTMEKWGLGWEDLERINPRLIMLRVSGYGQDGPRKSEPGFAAVAEAMGGLRYINGHPGQVPTRAGLSLGDTISGLHGALGVLLALYERDCKLGGSGRGQVVDVALYESIFNLTESMLPEYHVFGAVRQPSGGALTGIAPSNAYLTQSGEYVLIAANGDSLFQRLMTLMNRLDLRDDPELAKNDGRAKRATELDEAINAWTQTKSVDEILDLLKEASVPAGRIYTIEDIAQDPHYRARGVIETVTSAAGLEVEMPGVIPKLSKTPGAIRHRAPTLGEHTQATLLEHGFSEEQIQILKDQGILG